jgi:acetoin utilization deacetylase AcuC-like enzyme
MKKTGVFYHDVCGREAYSSLAMGVADGFEAIKKEGLFNEPNVKWFESRRATEKEIARIHTQKWIDEIKRGEYWNCSLCSIGGLLGATEKVLKGELDNAFVIAGVGGHHAHRDSAWGGCYFSVTGLGIPHARETIGFKRFAIVDTDTHHADGVRDIFKDDDNVLHICLCGGGSWWDEDYSNKQTSSTKFCFPHGYSDEKEIEIVRQEVPQRVKAFKPDLLYWICGMDTHVDSYGTQALTSKAYPELAKIIINTAEQACEGNLIVKTCCNAPPHATAYIVPRIVDLLSETMKLKNE